MLFGYSFLSGTRSAHAIGSAVAPEWPVSGACLRCWREAAGEGRSGQHEQEARDQRHRKALHARSQISPEGPPTTNLRDLEDAQWISRQHLL